MRVFRTTWWGQTSDVWLLSSHSWDGDSYTPCSLTQQLCEHAPTLTPVFLAHLHSGSVGSPVHTHTHTHTHTPTHTYSHTGVPCVSGRCIQKRVCQDRAGVDFSGHRLGVQASIPVFLKLNINYYFKPCFCLPASFPVLIHVKLHQFKVSLVNSGLFTAAEPGKACVVLKS